MQCATHPKVETMLGCGKCGKPICPRCSVATPVGFRCESCAQVRKNPMLVMNAGEHATAASAALVLALAGGVVWALVNGALGGFLSIFAAAGVGYMISEGLMRATNRKPVAYLRYAAGAAAILAFFAGNVLTQYWFDDAPIMTALTHFWAERYASAHTPSGQLIAEAWARPDLWTILAVGLSVYIAASRMGR